VQDGGRRIEKEVAKQLRAAKIRFSTVFSHGQYLDVLPLRASKGKAVRYLADKWDIPYNRVLVAGDSGNDGEMLRGNTLGVVVGNYSPELEALRGSLVISGRLAAVGELAAGMAHEIKNPLAGIKGSVEIVLQDPNIAAEDRSLIEKAVEEIRRIELLIKSLLNFAKPPRLQLLPTDINDLLDKTISFSLQNPKFAQNPLSPIKIIKDFDLNLPQAMADPMQLQQVFLNLMFNAIEAMPSGGALAVGTSYDSAMKSIKIAIADTGHGIKQSMLDIQQITGYILPHPAGD